MSNVSRYSAKVLSGDNGSLDDRGFRQVRMANSSSFRVGDFFDPYTGTNGAQSFTANQRVRGIVTNIETFVDGGWKSVFDAPSTRAGTTVVQPTVTVPGRYTTTSDNVALGDFADRIQYQEIFLTDRIEAYLSTGTGGNLAVRGTTAASAVLNNFIEPDPNFPHLLLESSANAASTGLCFQIVALPPGAFNRVIVRLILADGAVA